MTVCEFVATLTQYTACMCVNVCVHVCMCACVIVCVCLFVCALMSMYMSALVVLRSVGDEGSAVGCVCIWLQ